MTAAAVRRTLEPQTKGGGVMSTQPGIDGVRRQIAATIHAHWKLVLVQGIVLMVFGFLAVVEPNVITGDLQDAVEAVGLFYPPDPASLRQSVIGGNVAECAGGPRAFKYGTTRRYVLGLEAVLPTGEIISTPSPPTQPIWGEWVDAGLWGVWSRLGA